MNTESDQREQLIIKMSNYHSVSARLFTLKCRNPKDRNHLNIYGAVQDAVMHQRHQQPKEKSRDRLSQIETSVKITMVRYLFCEQRMTVIKAFFMRFEKIIHQSVSETQKHPYL